MDEDGYGFDELTSKHDGVGEDILKKNEIRENDGLRLQQKHECSIPMDEDGYGFDELTSKHDGDGEDILKKNEIRENDGLRLQLKHECSIPTNVSEIGSVLNYIFYVKISNLDMFIYLLVGQFYRIIFYLGIEKL